ncbi:MAG: sulfite exporter TauE/SafE family protein [Flavobacteriaceae bacterium]|nr:sulfite exporter TauE/SafE family protein [Flavobacteriaceae bacterium]
MAIESYLFYALIPIVAFLYSSVGHGGASGYLALMAVFSFPSDMMKQTALLLNLFVAGIAFYQYYKGGYFNRSLFIFFALGSVPAAFLGGLWSLDPWLYKKILGFILFFAIARMLFKKESTQQKNKQVAAPIGLIIGVVIGLFSGLIGIGGGIILTPVILLFHWGTMKEAAAVSALFIWVNSASGLFGQLSSGVNLTTNAVVLVGLALVGGIFGSYYGSQRWNNRRLEYFLALVLTSAGIKLILF